MRSTNNKKRTHAHITKEIMKQCSKRSCRKTGGMSVVRNKNHNKFNDGVVLMLNVVLFFVFSLFDILTYDGIDSFFSAVLALRFVLLLFFSSVRPLHLSVWYEWRRRRRRFFPLSNFETKSLH